MQKSKSISLDFKMLQTACNFKEANVSTEYFYCHKQQQIMFGCYLFTDFCFKLSSFVAGNQV